MTTATAPLTVNGRPMAADGIATVGELLQRLEVRPERVVVELNGAIFRRGEGLAETLRPGDVIEVVHFVGGG